MLIGFTTTRLMFLYLFLDKRKEIKKNIIIIAEILFEILIKKANKKREMLGKERCCELLFNLLLK